MVEERSVKTKWFADHEMVYKKNIQQHQCKTRSSMKKWCMVIVFLAFTGSVIAQENSKPPILNGQDTVISLTDQGTVELHVANLPLATVLRLLSLKGKKNIIASPNVKGSVTANLYDVTFEEALNAILVPNDATYRQVGNFIYIYTTEELKTINAAARGEPITHVFMLNYISGVDAKMFVEPMLDGKGTVSASPATPSGLSSSAEEGGGQSDAGTSFIIVTATPDKLRKVENILKQIDVRPRQVLIEATILRAALTDQNALGIDFTLLGGVDLELLGISSPGFAGMTLGQLPQDRFERSNLGATTDLAGNVATGGLTFGIVKDQVAVFVRALEQITDTVVVANPKILTLNKQKGQVIVGRRDGFITTTVTETQAIQTVQFLETGTQLIFRPFISDDGYIRVELHPEDSVGFVNAQGLPSEQTTEVTTNVIIRDGETILIGGLFREVTTDSRSQVPFFGDIPFIGQLFRSNEDNTTREEVIILLTVHIVKDRESYADDSQDQLENIERIRVGARQGLMWHGRERLAQTHYHKALDAVNTNNKEDALWHLNMALHNNSRFISAIRLKEDILGQRSWEDDASGGRSFLHRMIAKERGYVLPLFGQPATPKLLPDQAEQPETDTKENDTP